MKLETFFLTASGRGPRVSREGYLLSSWTRAFRPLLALSLIFSGWFGAGTVSGEAYRFLVTKGDDRFDERERMDLNREELRAGQPFSIRLQVLDRQGDPYEPYNRNVTLQLRAMHGQVTEITVPGTWFVDGVAEFDPEDPDELLEITPLHAATHVPFISPTSGVRFWATDGNIITDNASGYFSIEPAGFRVTYAGGNRGLNNHTIIEGRPVLVRVRALNADLFGSTATGYRGVVTVESEGNSMVDPVFGEPIPSLFAIGFGGVSDYDHRSSRSLNFWQEETGDVLLASTLYQPVPEEASARFDVVARGGGDPDIELDNIELVGGRPPYPGETRTLRYRLNNEGDEPTMNPIDTLFELLDPSRNNAVILRWVEQFTGVIDDGGNSGNLFTSFAFPQNLMGDGADYTLRIRPNYSVANEEEEEFSIDTFPDLAITHFDYTPGQYRAGDAMRFRSTFVNRTVRENTIVPASAVAYDQWFKMQIHLSRNPVFGDGDDFLVWEKSFRGNDERDPVTNRLPPGQQIDLTEDFLLPTNFEGTFYLLARINSAGGREADDGFEPEHDPGLPGNNTTPALVAQQITILPRQSPETVRVSLTDGGEQSNQYSDNAVVSADGQSVAFESQAALAGNSGGTNNIFLRNRSTGRTLLISAATGGASPNGPSGRPSISDDGRFVVFHSNAGNLVADDTNGYSDVFVRDVWEEYIWRLSVNPVTLQQGNGGSQLARISADGRFVVFESEATNLLDPNDPQAGAMAPGVRRIYLHDRDVDGIGVFDAFGNTSTRLVSPGNLGSEQPGISKHGDYVVFSTRDPAVLGRPASFPQIVRWERETGSFTPVSVDAGDSALFGNNISGYPAISADGSYVAFASRAQNLTRHWNPQEPELGGDRYQQSIPHVFRARLTGGVVEEIIRLNAQDGSEPNMVTSVFAPDLGSFEPSISSDGRVITFTSESNNLLGPLEVRNVDRTFEMSARVFNHVDDNFSADVYVWEFSEGGEPSIRRASVSSFGFGTHRRLPGAGSFLGYPTASRRPAISRDGRFVVFTSDAKRENGLVFGATNYEPLADNGLAGDIYLFDLKRGLIESGTAPAVALRHPAFLQLAAGTDLTLVADAVSFTSQVTEVEFYANNQLVGMADEPAVSGSGRFLLTWSIPPPLAGNPNPRNYQIVAIAVDANGVRSTISNPVRLTATPFLGSLPPEVSLVRPGDEDVFTSASVVRLAAAASDPDGDLVKVEFHVNGTLLGTAWRGPSHNPATHPYSVEWPVSSPGIYTITAVAEDNSANRVMSEAVTVTATSGSNPPQVELFTTGPSVINPGGVVPLSASAAPGSGRVVQSVSFLVNGEVFASSSLPPFNTLFDPEEALGVYQFTALALDDAGNKVESNMIQVAVEPVHTIPGERPLVELFLPPTVKVNRTAGQALRVAARAEVGNPLAAMSAVEFYLNGILQETVPTAEADFWGQYVFNWPIPLLPGNRNPIEYRITAVAVDTNGERSFESHAAVVTSFPPSPPAPQIEIINPPDGGVSLTNRSAWPFTARVEVEENPVEEVGFFIRRAEDGGLGILLGQAGRLPDDESFLLKFNFAGLPPIFGDLERLPAGDYFVTAVARDSKGNTATSAEVPLTLTFTVSPGFAFSSLTVNGQERAELVINEAVRFNAVLADPVPQIDSVRLYGNGILLAEMEPDPSQMQLGKFWLWEGILATSDDWDFHAVATDIHGNTAVSPSVEVIVRRAIMALDITADRVNPGDSVGIELEVRAGAPVIGFVDFFINGVFLRRDFSAPYQATWVASETPGVYEITASVWDEEINEFLAPPAVSVEVVLPPPPPVLFWTRQQVNWGDVSPATHLHGVTNHDGQFIAVGSQGVFLVGMENGEWTAGLTPVSATLRSVASGNGTLVSVGDPVGTGSGTIITSTDGQVWTIRSSGTTRALNAVAYGEGRFVAVGNSGVIRTSDDNGTNWQARSSSGATANLLGVTHGPAGFIAVGQNGTILTSPDGASWTARTPLITAPLHGVAYGGGIYVAVGGRWDSGGDSARILTSSDGVSWTVGGTGIRSILNGVHYSTGVWAAVGSGGMAASSADGFFWEANETSTTEDLTGIVSGLQHHVAVGRNGTIVRSTTANFHGWLAERFTPAEIAEGIVTSPGADPDGAGIPNLVRYALDINDPIADRGRLPQAMVMTENGDDFLVLRYVRSREQTDVLYLVEATTDFVSWDDIAPIGGTVHVEINGGVEIVTVRDGIPIGAAGDRRSLRLRLLLSR